MTNKHELIPRDWQVSDYCAKLGWYLVTIPAGSKGPTRFGWQQPEKALSDPDAARLYYEQNPNHNVGLLHGASGTCAVDIDNVEHTKMIFEELGIAFSELMQSAPQIIGRENRGKLIFKAPPDLITHKISWPVQDDPRKTEVVFELRAGAVQDVLPPSIHPDTGRPYEWAGRSIFDGLPDLPTQLLTLWREWDKFRPQMSAICPWRREPEFQPPRRPRPKGDGTSVIDAFNQAHDMHSLLVQYGYKQTAKDRYLSPNSTSGLAGVKLFKDGRAYSHHASDPFDNAHTFDAFELFLQFEHQGNVRKAVRKAARDAGLGNSETIATIKSGLEAGMLEPRTAAPRASDSQQGTYAVRKPDMSLLENPRADAPIFDPVRLFGKDWGDWVRTAAEGGAAPADYTAATLLSVAGSLIGNARWVKVSHSWQEPPLVWTMLIGNPSAGKTPGAKPVRRALAEIERNERNRVASQIEAWEKEAALCKLKLSAWQTDAKKALTDGSEPPPEPDGPGPRPWSPRLSLSDTTIEAAAQVLASQPKGLLINRDELAGVLGNLTRYANGGSDGPFYLEGYTGGSFASERKGSGSIYVSRLSLTLTGTIQPERLATLLLKAEDDGMLARFIPIFPELVPVGVSEVPEDFLFSEEAFRKLHRLKMVPSDIDKPNGDLRPLFVHFTEKSLAAMTDFRRYCRELEGQHYGLMISHIGKLPGMAARLSLILAYLDWAAGDIGLGEPIEIESDVFNRATDFCRDYVVPMASRAYAEAATPPAERAAMSLAHLIREERLTDLNPRVISRRNRSGLKDAREVKAAIAILVDAHWLTEHTEKTAGAPKTVWVVNPQVFN